MHKKIGTKIISVEKLTSLFPFFSVEEEKIDCLLDKKK